MLEFSFFLSRLSFSRKDDEDVEEEDPKCGAKRWLRVFTSNECNQGSFAESTVFQAPFRFILEVVVVKVVVAAEVVEFAFVVAVASKLMRKPSSRPLVEVLDEV